MRQASLGSVPARSIGIWRAGSVHVPKGISTGSIVFSIFRSAHGQPASVRFDSHASCCRPRLPVRSSSLLYALPALLPAWPISFCLPSAAEPERVVAVAGNCQSGRSIQTADTPGTVVNSILSAGQTEEWARCSFDRAARLRRIHGGAKCSRCSRGGTARNAFWKGKALGCSGNPARMAEEVGFEPTVSLTPRSISSRVP